MKFLDDNGEFTVKLIRMVIEKKERAEKFLEVSKKVKLELQKKLEQEVEQEKTKEPVIVKEIYK